MINSELSCFYVGKEGITKSSSTISNQLLKELHKTVIGGPQILMIALREESLMRYLLWYQVEEQGSFGVVYTLNGVMLKYPKEDFLREVYDPLYTLLNSTPKPLAKNIPDLFTRGVISSIEEQIRDEMDQQPVDTLPEIDYGHFSTGDIGYLEYEELSFQSLVSLLRLHSLVQVPLVPYSPLYTSQIEENRVETNNTARTKSRRKHTLFVLAGVLIAILFLILKNSPTGEDKTLDQKLTEKDIQKISKHYIEADKALPLIKSFRKEINQNLRSTEAKELLKKVTYKEMINFMTDAFLRPDLIEKWGEEAKIAYEESLYNQYGKEINKYLERWENYEMKHNTSGWIKVTPHPQYHEEQFEYSDFPIYYAGFYFEIDLPNGPIRDCKVRFGLWDKSRDDWVSGTMHTYSLNELQKAHKSADYYFAYQNSYKKDIFDRTPLRAEVLSVTLLNGKRLTPRGGKRIPKYYLAYKENRTPYTLGQMVILGLGLNVQNLDSFSQEYIRTHLHNTHPYPYELIEKAPKLWKKLEASIQTNT